MHIIIREQPNRSNSVNMYFPKELRSKIKGNQVVIKEKDGDIYIRESILMDQKTLTISNSNMVTYTSLNAKDYLGRWEIDKEGDYFILYRE